MSLTFFEHPILNSPYAYPARRWELDADGQPTNALIESRRRSDLITPVPKAKKRKAPKVQVELDLGADDAGLSTAEQRYDPTPIINELRGYVDTWRALPNPQQWQVTPETARLLQHWRHHQCAQAGGAAHHELHRGTARRPSGAGLQEAQRRRAVPHSARRLSRRLRH